MQATMVRRVAPKKIEKKMTINFTQSPLNSCQLSYWSCVPRYTRKPINIARSAEIAGLGSDGLGNGGRSLPTSYKLSNVGL